MQAQAISQKSWNKYLARKAAEFLKTKQVIKSHPIPGDGAQAPGYITLRQWGAEQWVTHFFNSQDGGFHNGHYFTSLTDAEADFARRVAEYAPARAAS